jgi:hypothetical protein
VIGDFSKIGLWPGHWNIAPLPKVAGSCICFHNADSIESVDGDKPVPKVCDNVRCALALQPFSHHLLLALQLGIDQRSGEFETQAITGGQSLSASQFCFRWSDWTCHT